MKRKIALFTTLALILICVSLTSTDSRVLAQAQLRVVGDSGLITGSNQTLQVITKWEGPDFDAATIRFVQISYADGGCNGFVCKQVASSQTTSVPITLAPREVGKLEFPNLATGGRVIVLSNRRNMQVNFSIVDSTTGQVNATWVFTESWP